jgi:hypothetical protein
MDFTGRTNKIVPISNAFSEEMPNPPGERSVTVPTIGSESESEMET